MTKTKSLNILLWSMMLLALVSVAWAAGSESEKATNGFDDFFGTVNSWIGQVLFYDVLSVFTETNPGVLQVLFNVLSMEKEVTLPFIVFWLILGGIYFTIRMGFVNFRLFGHAIKVVRGKYKKESDEGDVTPFQALTTALSATVGLGNIAGVAVALSIGGAGATFWMIVAGLFGMSLKFSEVTLAQTYRVKRADGRMMGGAMEYLERGFADLNWPKLGKVLAVLFCILCIGASLGGGNMFQVNQSMAVVEGSVTWFKENHVVYGLIMATLVGAVILGGLKRIAHTAEAIVPLMAMLYVTACVIIIAINADKVPGAFSSIVGGAFSMEAGIGGLIGVLIQGFKRAAFSNEAGIGSAPIVHSAAQSEYPARQGCVALLEPFIDTIVICTMTALVIVISGVLDNEAVVALGQSGSGAAVTSHAFNSHWSWFPSLLSVCVFLFAFSTMISWSYYGERCFTYLASEKYSMIYRVTFVGFVIMGSVVSAKNVLEFGDLLLLGMALPNLIGLYFMQDVIRKQLSRYQDVIKAEKESN